MSKKSARVDELIKAPPSELQELAPVNAATVNLWAKEVAKQVKANPFALADTSNPSDELLQRAKYLLSVADPENKAFAKDYFNDLLNRHVCSMLSDSGEALDYEKDILPNQELLAEYKRIKNEVNNPISLASVNKNISYTEFLNRLAFKAELAKHVKMFRENSQSTFLNSFVFLKFWEALTKKFPAMSPEEIKSEIKSYREDFLEDERAKIGTLLMAKAAYNKLALRYSYDTEAKDIEEKLSILEDFNNGRDSFATLLLYKPDKEAELSLSEEAGIDEDKVNFHIEQTVVHIANDLILNTTLRRALENDLDQMELFGKNKIQRNKKNNPVYHEQGKTAIALAKKLRKLSNEYFMNPAKTPEKKIQFKTDCNAEIKKANDILGKTIPFQWKVLIKNVALIISAIATGGVALIAKAAYSKAKTGKVGSLFYRSKDNKEGRRKLEEITSKLSSPHFKEDEQIEMTNSKKPKSTGRR